LLAAADGLRTDAADLDGAPTIGPIRHVHTAMKATQRNSITHLD
jgi:hypothetical protein